MQTSFPHPPTLVAISTATKRRLQEHSDQAATGRWPPTSTNQNELVHQEYLVKDVGVYRENGRPDAAYDLEYPFFPEGGEPGIGDLLFTPVIRRGRILFDRKVINFKTVADLECQGISVDTTCARVGYNQHGGLELLVARNEDELTSKSNEASLREFDRKPIATPEDLEGDLQFFFFSMFIDKIFAADTEERLSSLLKDNFPSIAP